MIGDESGDESVESLAESEEGEGGKGIMEGSVLHGGDMEEAAVPGVIDQGSEKDALLNGTSIGKAGIESDALLLYETMESLLDGNSEVSQSVSIDTMEEDREESGFHWIEGELKRDSFPSSLYRASSSTMLD